jgi:hypothetical protein
MKKPESFTISIGVDVETAVYDMFDIATDLNLLVSMVDETKAFFAEEAKQRIMDTLITWIDCNEKGE